jgi:hypothetical protein
MKQRVRIRKEELSLYYNASMTANSQEEIQTLIQRVQKTQHGFTDIQKAGEEIFASHSRTETLSLAKELSASNVYQVRMLATVA